MKPKEQNIAIAKALGRKPGQYYCSLCRECVPIETVTSGGYHSKCGGAVHLDLPDFTSDLDACHEMEKHLPDYRLFIGHLVSVLKSGEYSVHATAAQRSEAFLKCLGLWQDDPAKSS